jgi:hypothetical protein
MPGFYGTEQQIALQSAVEAAGDWLAQTPGACNAGRFLGTDDPELLGWDSIFDILGRDGIFGFRLVSSADLGEIEAHLQQRKFRIDFYDVFIATAAEAAASVSLILETGLPEGFNFGASLVDAGHQRTQSVQAFMASNGIAPFSGSMLIGDDGPAQTVTILDQQGNLAAAAHAYFPHNVHSKHNQSACCGLVAVSPTHRGKGLGKQVNAKIVAECVGELGATSIHEYVASTNIPSRKMLQSSGLRMDSELKGGIAVVDGAERFTR